MSKVFFMINQSWNISSDEVKRILQLHETATKKQYIIKEQTITTKLDPKTFELSKQTFASGKHSESSLSQQQKADITTTLEQIATYLKEKKGVPMSIQIEAGESLPTNYDNEANPPLKLGSGELAKKRGETIKTLLSNYFQGLVNKGELPEMPSIPDAKPIIGTTPRGFDKDDPRYQKEQFIKFQVIASGEETTVCLVGLKVIFNYVHQESTNPLLVGCRGGHQCNEAIFDVYLNKTKIGQADLNNGDCEGDPITLKTGNFNNCNRRATLTVTPEMVTEIVNGEDFKKSQKLTLWYQCIVPNCHANIPEIYIYNKEGKSLFPNTTFPSPCVSTGAKRGDMDPKYLMTLDGCGNTIQMGQQQSAEEMKRIRDEIAAEEAAKVQKEKEERERLEAEQAAKKQQYLDYGMSNGFELIPGRTNTNLWSGSGAKIISQEIVDSYYVVTAQKINNQLSDLRYIVDPITPGNVKWAVPPKATFKAKYPIKTVDSSNRQKKFEKDNTGLVSLGNGYYYSGWGTPTIDGNPRKDLIGTVLKVNFV